MIRKCVKLTKVQLKGIVFSGQFGAKRGQKAAKAATMSLVLALVGLVFIFYSAFFSWAYIMMGLSETVMPLMMTVSSIMILFTTMAKASSFIFSSRDNDLLMSLPVTNWAIIVSRFASLYIYETVITAVIMLPALCVYSFLCGPSPVFVLGAVISMFFVPLVPLAIATVIGIVITYIAARFKYKNIVVMVLGTAAFLAVMYFSFNISSVDETKLLQMNTLIMDMVSRLYPLAALYISGMGGNFLAYAGYLVVSIAVAGIIISLIAWRFNRLCAALTAHRVRGNFKMTQLKTGTVFGSLLKREFKRYFSSTIYVLNTALIYVLLIIGAVALFFIKDLDAVLNIPEAGTMIGALVPLLIAFFAGITSTTSASLSLEGKNLWLVASFPVRSITVFHAKIGLNLILGIPCVLIAAVLCAVRFQLGFTDIVFTVLIPVLFTLLAAVGGMALNIHFPNFTWTNEAAVVKQGAAPTITVFGGMALVFIPGAILFMTQTPSLVLYTILAVVLIILIILFYMDVRRTRLVQFLD
ncbi:ABC-2 type transport system permease protein [Catenibacillus scindens]|uniref:ABC-2 type transport system permease protein n=1 Tax=Catenibacillus scindens TaxID=673271 RepID=A0A7W8H7W1_9FIRM|nr:hypothetical protein [Catenibacillus scindens]MBB5263506.1 ABC-2 type transport system permease protein [Catenibacillus scindens]